MGGVSKSRKAGRAAAQRTQAILREKRAIRAARRSDEETGSGSPDFNGYLDKPPGPSETPMDIALDPNERNFESVVLAFQLKMSKFSRRCVVCLNHVGERRQEEPKYSQRRIISHLLQHLVWTPEAPDNVRKYCRQFGSPSTWAPLCDTCEGLVELSLDKHREVEGLMNEIAKLRRKLFDENFYESESEEEDDGMELGDEKQVYSEIRQRLTQDYNESSERPDFFCRSVFMTYKVKTSESALPVVIKRELESDDGMWQEGDFEEPSMMEDESFEAGGDAFDEADVVGYSEILANNENTSKQNSGGPTSLPFKQKMKRKRPTQHSSESDSDEGSESDRDSTGQNRSVYPSQKPRKALAQEFDPQDIPQEVPLTGKECPVCKREFSVPGKMRRHYRTVHLKQRDFSCHLCGQQFSRKEPLAHHIEQKRCTTSTLSAKPKARSTPPKNSSLACSICQQEFSCTRNVKRHMKTAHQHSALEYFTCDICDASFQRKDYVLRHKRAAHSGDAKATIINYPCPHCEKIFNSGNIRKHILQAHENEKTHLCNICGAAFADEEGLKNHNHIRHPDAVQCDLCVNSYKNLAELAEHFHTDHAGKDDDNGSS